MTRTSPSTVVTDARATLSTALPEPGDFPAPPDAATRRRWLDADRASRPDRVRRLRKRMADEDVDAYFGVRTEHMRWLTGLVMAEGEDRVAGHSGQFLLGAEQLISCTDSRYTEQARREATEASVLEIGYDLASVWPDLLARVDARRVGVEAAAVSHALWGRLEAAAPDVELVPADGWIEAMRAVKEPEEIERIAAASAVADRALAALLPEIHPGVTEHALALRLEWLMRTGGAEALAFDVACLAGPEAALPHGSPGDRPVLANAVLLFDFGAQVEGYRSDMTRTLFVGEPRARDLELYELVARAQQASIDAVGASAAASRDGEPMLSGLAADGAARDVIARAGFGDRFGHGTGHGIGLATHELPSLSRSAADEPLPSPTVFSVEPGIYLPGETGVRIEDLVHLDVARGVTERLTGFPREVLVLPA
jgi:Xaa-Pro aminopeptidase